MLEKSMIIVAYKSSVMKLIFAIIFFLKILNFKYKNANDLSSLKRNFSIKLIILDCLNTIHSLLK